MTEMLLRRRDGPVTRLTLNRPDKANALSAELVEALIEAVDQAHEDGTRLLVLNGVGPHFCAGFDFTDLDLCSDAVLVLRFIRIEILLQKIHHAPFATLATVRGRNFGAGADLVVSCDMRVAEPGASFRFPGLCFDVVLGTRRLAERIGAGPAREILSASQTLAAADALRLGLLTRVVAPDEWPQMEAQQAETCTVLSSMAQAALHRRTVVDTRAEDLAELIRSVSVPGLKERIRAYRAMR